MTEKEDVRPGAEATKVEAEAEAAEEGPSTVALPVSSDTLLDPESVVLLQATDTFYVRQKLQWIEALTQGCWEQPNIYTIMDKQQDNKPIFFGL